MATRLAKDVSGEYAGTLKEFLAYQKYLAAMRCSFNDTAVMQFDDEFRRCAAHENFGLWSSDEKSVISSTHFHSENRRNATTGHYSSSMQFFAGAPVRARTGTNIPVVGFFKSTAALKAQQHANMTIFVGSAENGVTQAPAVPEIPLESPSAQLVWPHSVIGRAGHKTPKIVVFFLIFFSSLNQTSIVSLYPADPELLACCRLTQHLPEWENESSGTDEDTDFILKGLCTGFMLLPDISIVPPSECANYSSALNPETKQLLDKLFKEELSGGKIEL